MLSARPARDLCARLAVAAVFFALATAIAVGSMAAIHPGVAAAAPPIAAAEGVGTASQYLPTAAQPAASELPATEPGFPDPAIGQAGAFWAKDWSTGGYRRVEATVAYVGEHSVIYVENGELVAPVTAQLLGDEFDSRVYPRVTAVFGEEPNPGIDDDPRVTILLYDLGDIHYSGYFEPADLNPPLDEAHSNRREMIYLDSGSVANEPQNAGSLAAHEFAHLIVYYRDYLLDPSPGRTVEPSWLAEGLSAYAEHVAGYDGRVGSQLRSFANDPDTNLTSWVDTWNHYGAGYAFVSYLAAREGQDFIRALVDYPADGIVGINDVLRLRGTAFDTFDTLLDDWVVANFLDTRPPEIAEYSYSDITVAATPLTVDGPLPKLGYQLVSNFGAVYLDFPATSPESVFNVTIDGERTPPLRAALISWDSAGVLPPEVSFLTLNGGDGSITVSAGRDRHTLAVWARGPLGEDALYSFHYAAAADPPGGIQFLDLSPSDQYYAPVTELLERHVISGYEIPPGSGLWYFKGTNNLTRGQFAKIIMEAIGLHTLAIDHPDDPSFSDVPLVYEQGQPKAYPYDYVEEAAALGIVEGYGDGTFHPYNPITRAQLVLMITRGARAVGKPLPDYSGSQQVFADVPPSNPRYRDIMAAYTAGIVGGSPGKDGRLYFYPASSASRYHVAKMTANLLHFLDGFGQ